MSELNRCARCGSLLPETGVLEGRCPRCMIEGALGSTSGVGDADSTVDFAPLPNTGAKAHPKAIGRYRILRMIGEGGMGVVYEAEQEHPRRIVALKIIKPSVASAETISRFEHEAHALGKLQHPGIAQIYEAGTADTGFGPQPYFAMELIRGLTPREYVAQHNLSVRERLELVAKIAEAVHHAHQRGLIHRDLKPNNILVDDTGQPKVLDFGVARAVDDEAQHTHNTDPGQLVGTLAYMSPEQVLADANEIDTRTDVYALGVLLYELLTGRLPYNTNRKLHEVLAAIRQEDPTMLGTLDRVYKGDVETIAAKALEKEKSRRYASAAELAADIRRYLTDQPITARPPTATYQLIKFARRNRTLVAGVTGVFTVLVCGVTVSSWQAVRARRAEHEALAQLDRANAERDRATAAQGIANAERDRANIAQQEASAERNRALTAEGTARREADLANTQRLITVWQSLVRESLRESAIRVDFDIAALLALQAMRFNTRIPDQPRFAVEDALLQAARLDPAPHALRFETKSTFGAVAFSPDGSRLAGGGADQIVRLWDMRSPNANPLVFPAVGYQSDAVGSIVFSADGKRMAISSVGAGALTAPIRIWDLQNPAAPPLMLDNAGSVDSLAFSPDGMLLAGASEILRGSNAGGVRIWDLRNPGTPRFLSRHDVGSSYIQDSSVEFSRDGKYLAAASMDTLQVWDLRSPNEVRRSLRLQPSAAPAAVGSSQTAATTVYSVAFSPDCAHLAVSSTDGVQVLDVQNLEAAPLALVMPGAPPYSFKSLSYSSDGTRLAGTNTVAWIWDMRNTGTGPTNLIAGPGSSVTAVAYAPDGTRLAASTTTGIRVWDFQNLGRQPSVSPMPKGSGFEQSSLTRTFDVFSFSPDLTRLADTTTKALRLWDLQRLDAPPTQLDGFFPVSGSGGRIRTSASMVFSADGTRLATSVLQPNGIGVSTWQLGTSGSQPPIPRSFTISDSFSGFPRAALSADGSRLAVTGSMIHVVDLRNPDGPILRLGSPQTSAAQSPTFSPDGNRIAVVVDERTVQLWDLRNPNAPPLLFPMPAPQALVNLAFSPDGLRLAAATGAVQASVWDIRKPGPPAWQFAGGSVLVFSRDGKRLATGVGRNVRIWDLQTSGTPPLELLQETGGAIYKMAFSRDDASLSVANSEGKILVWNLWTAAADSLCKRVWRNLSKEEWRYYVGESIPYERTCPALPAGAGISEATVTR